MSTTVFRGKVCPKCGRNHSNEGNLCSFCKREHEAALEKQKTSPDHMWVECLIERDGDTVLNIGQIRYLFKKNEQGHSVCEVINMGHYRQIMKSGYYVPYDFRTAEEEQKPARPILSPEDGEVAKTMVSSGKSNVEIAAVLSVGKEKPITWQRVAKYLSSIKEA